MKLQTDI